MAPRDWPDFVGQEDLTQPTSLLRKAIENDRLGSSIFFGPSGTGKTALARLAAKKSKAAIEYVNAVTAGVADLRAVVLRAQERRRMKGQRTLLVVDEIHHFNRTQQDALLPDVERGLLTLIGLTTENPFFYVNSALMSRSMAYEFKPLEKNHLTALLNLSLADADRGLGAKSVTIKPDAADHLMLMANGDARRMFNILELAELAARKENQPTVITLLDVEAGSQRRALRYDKFGDDHYDTISAFIKSMRGSDPDAALYWMAKMLRAGEDPRFIARRIMIFASEDVGNADPQAIAVANAVSEVVAKVGMPEARIPLAQAVTYVSCAPKSNSAIEAIDSALDEVDNGARREVPNHLRDATGDRASRGHGIGYQYPHSFPGHHVKQTYMTDRKDFYKPSDQGFEAALKKRLEEWRKNNPS